MKNLKFIISILIISITVSCAVKKPTAMPVKEKVILTRAEIQEIGKKKDLEAQQKYESIKSTKTFRAAQPLVTNMYSQMDIREVLSDIMGSAGINIIADQTVEGYVSLELKGVPLEEALRQVLFPVGCDFKYIEEGDYYIVGKILPENPNFDDFSITKVIKTNGLAEDVISQISGYYDPFVTFSGHNITITASPEIANRIERDISLIDRSKYQIEISAQFVMVEWETGTTIGMEWSDLDLGAIGIGNIAKGLSSAFSLDLASNLGAFLKANGYSANISTLAEPRVIVEEGSIGELKVTEEHLFLILSGGGSSYNYFTTKDIEVGIKLKVEPYVTREGDLRLNINPEVAEIVGEREFDSGNGASQKLPIIARRSTSTIINLENGETVAMGGLITKTSTEKKSGIPVLRSIPLIGFVFGRKAETEKETEMVIFLNANIVANSK